MEIDIIKQVITESENRITKKLKRIKEDLNADPWGESIKITNEILALINAPIGDDYLEKLEILKSREKKNTTLTKRMIKKGFSGKLIDRQIKLESQLNKLFKLKICYERL